MNEEAECYLWVDEFQERDEQEYEEQEDDEDREEEEDRAVPRNDDGWFEDRL